ncbi:MAG: hypothetical protein IM568_04625 [Flavobacterium sp.]|nr:hypothetical protein [Flavobacterium sp.]
MLFNIQIVCFLAPIAVEILFLFVILSLSKEQKEKDLPAGRQVVTESGKMDGKIAQAICF